MFVLGNACIDITLPVRRWPVAGETLVAEGISRAPGGKGLNQAVVAARAGAEVRFCAPLGAGADAAMIRDVLEAEGFAGLHLPDVGRATDLSMLLVTPDGENRIVSAGACADALSPNAAAAFVADMADDDFLLIQGNLSQAATLAALRGRVLNTAPLRWDYASLLPRCEVVIANRFEAGRLSGLDDPAEAARRLGGRVGIVTLGRDGCVVAAGATLARYAAQPVAAVDTTGAGDTFAGVLVAIMALGMDLASAVIAAQSAAALAVTRHGCFGALPTRRELNDIITIPVSTRR